MKKLYFRNLNKRKCLGIYNTNEINSVIDRYIESVAHFYDVSYIRYYTIDGITTIDFGSHTMFFEYEEHEDKRYHTYEVIQFGKVLSIIPAINKKDAHNKFFNIICQVIYKLIKNNKEIESYGRLCRKLRLWRLCETNLAVIEEAESFKLNSLSIFNII